MRSGKLVGVAALSMSIGLFAIIGVRVKETLADRKVLAAKLDEKSRGGAARAAVTTVHGVPQTWRPAIPVTGSLSPIQDADIGFKMGGRLQALRVKVGDRVQAGQPLATLDTAEVSAQSAAAGAGVRAAEIALEMARDAERRTAALFAQSAVSEVEQTAAKHRTALAAAQLEQARAQQRLASVTVGNGALSAPFAGLVTRTPNGVGKIVGPGEPLFRVEDTRTLKLSATVSEADARLIEVGAEVMVGDELSPAEADKVDAGAKLEKPRARGKITAVLGSLDPQTRRVPVLAEIPNENEAPLLAGSFVRAVVGSAHPVAVLELPADALRPGSQDEVVALVDGKAHLLRLSFVLDAKGSLLVRSGLSASDVIVRAPSSEIAEGAELGAAAEAH